MDTQATKLTGPENLRRVLADGRLIRQSYGEVVDGKQMLCALTAWMDDPTARPGQCHAPDAPDWFLAALPWIDDSGTDAAWPGQMARLAAVVCRAAMEGG